MYDAEFGIGCALFMAISLSMLLRYRHHVVWAFALSVGAINSALLLVVFALQHLGMPFVIGLALAFYSHVPSLWLADKILARRLD